MPTATINGTDIAYRLEGKEDAPVIVFSSSLATDNTMWNAQTADLGGDFRILRYDHRGHGGSSCPDGPYTIEDLARDVLGLLDELGMDKVNYCGLSLGGMVGQWLGINAAERLDKLVLSNTTSFMEAKDVWDERAQAVLDNGMDAVVEGSIDRWFSDGYKKNNPKEIDRTRAMIRATKPKGYAACCSAIKAMDFRDELQKITVPVLSISGENDGSTPPKEAEFIKDRVKDGRLLVIDGALHLSNMEAPGEYNAALRDFLG